MLEEKVTPPGAQGIKLSLDEVDDLLKAIYNTLEIEEEKLELPKHDQMYEGSNAKKSRVFPVHSSLVEYIKLEWQNPERKNFFSGSLGTKAPLSKISKKSDMAFDDMGTRKDSGEMSYSVEPGILPR